MKPIKLAFSGLNSYRDEQTVDFAELGQAGIFGVFGPTGGGKSSLLDAITLALFGRVERARNGTRGIMNQNESRLTVSFDFALADTSYRAERVYQRDKNDPDSIKVKNARLLKMSGGGTVLADKAQEVDAAVADLLGMSFEDFTRAVILPQGKFDQFLKLTGGDRARMLENILRLERFGEGLWKKASRLETDLATEIDTLQKLMGQLGDASDGAVAQAVRELAVHTEKLAMLETELLSLEAQFNELVNQARKSEELSDLKKTEAVLKKRGPFFDAQQDRLARGQKAEPMRELNEQVEQIAKQEAAEDQIVVLKTKAVEEAGRNLRAAEGKLERAKARGPELKELRENTFPKAMLAVSYQERREILDREIQALVKKLGAGQKEMAEMVAAGKEINQVLEGVMAERERLQIQRKALEKLFAHRVQAETVLTARTEAENAKRQAEEAAAALNKKEALLMAEEGRFRRLLAQKISVPPAGPEAGRWSEWADRAVRFLTGAEEQFIQAEETREKALMQNMAAALAEKLSEGTPCPVCGSPDHPRPAGAEGADEAAVAAARSAAAKAKAQLEEIRQWERTVGTSCQTLAALQEEVIGQYRPVQQAKNEGLKQAEERLEKAEQDFHQNVSGVIGEMAAAGLPDRLVKGNFLNRIREWMAESESLYSRTGEQLNEAESRVERLKSEIAALREKYSELKAETAGMEATIAQKQAESAQMREKSQTITGDVNPAEFVGRVKEKMARLEAENEQAQKGWETAGAESQKAAQELLAARVSLEKTRSHLTGVRTNLANRLRQAGFPDLESMRGALMDEKTREQLAVELQEYQKALGQVSVRLLELEKEMPAIPVGPAEVEEGRKQLEAQRAAFKEAAAAAGASKERLADLQAKKERWEKLKVELSRIESRKELASRLVSLVKGRRFVQFLAEEHLQDMAREASIRLSQLTAYRYGLELDGAFNFILRDDFSGGQRRPVNSLSGGETFLTSLALALSLSSKIQLKGQYPLGFFFLDEGFGTLDPEKLELVMQTLERLHDGARMVGVITHVPELRHRIPRYLEVLPACADGQGSRIIMK